MAVRQCPLRLGACGGGGGRRRKLFFKIVAKVYYHLESFSPTVHQHLCNIKHQHVCQKLGTSEFHLASVSVRTTRRNRASMLEAEAMDTPVEVASKDFSMSVTKVASTWTGKMVGSLMDPSVQLDNREDKKVHRLLNG